MVLDTSRFGAVTLTDEDIIEFPEGLLGFNHLHRFVLLDDPGDEVFAWLQSCDDVHIAFPVLEPQLFTDRYEVHLSRTDLQALQLDSDESKSLHCFSIITIPEDPRRMTANLKAPVVINSQRHIGRQCVLQDNHLAIRESIFNNLQQRMVQNPSGSFKTQISQVGVSLPKSGHSDGPPPMPAPTKDL